jgi:hypothetical protein
MYRVGRHVKEMDRIQIVRWHVKVFIYQLWTALQVGVQASMKS